MTWLGRLRFWGKAEPRPVPAVTAPAGIEHLRGLAGLAPRDTHPPVEIRPAETETAIFDRLLQEAEAAQTRKDWPEAEILWRRMRARFPNVWYPYTGAATAMAELGRLDEGRQVLEDCLRRFAWEPAIHYAMGNLAKRCADWPAAETSWRRALALGRQPWWIYAELAHALMEQGRLGDAESALSDGIAQDPKEVALWSGYARVAERRQDWAAAAERWTAAKAQCADSAVVRDGLHNALLQLAEVDPAAFEAAAGSDALPQVRGRLAARRGDWTEAAGHFRAALRLPDQAWWVHTALAEALAEQDRGAEADAVLRKAADLFPKEPGIVATAAALAERSGDWAAAVRYWAAFQHRFPFGEGESHRLHTALLRLAETDPAEADRLTRALPSEPDALRDLALSFESLGGTYPGGGCEFGFFQRSCGAEPLGLLRWAFVSPEALLTCLATRFDGVGEPETTEIYTAEHEPNPMWDVRDRRMGIALHSFVSAREVPRERMEGLTFKRMRYLRQQLLRDLADPVRIFVYKSASRWLTDAELTSLGGCMAAYGPGILLCVVAADAGHPAGSVIAYAPNLLLGYLDFSDQEDHRSRNPDWLVLCRAVLRNRPLG